KWGMLGAFEGLGELEPFLPEREKEFGRGFLEGMLAGRRMTAAFWAEIRRERGKLNRWCAEIFERYDLVLTPTVPFDPPPPPGEPPPLVPRNLRALRPRAPADRPVRSAARARAAPGGDGGPPPAARGGGGAPDSGGPRG